MYAPDDASAEMASFYGDELRGSPMANGVPFVPENFTVAHPFLPFGAEVTVCHHGCVLAVVTDRGPFIGGRDIDLSKGTADVIGVTPLGVAPVEIIYH
jgi:rare lipoprotein A